MKTVFIVSIINNGFYKQENAVSVLKTYIVHFARNIIFHQKLYKNINVRNVKRNLTMCQLKSV
jgi:hypothetical protein